jgi:hypothetical protein
MIGLLFAALNGLHMMQTTVIVPTSPSVRLLAPGFMEMAALAGSGAFVGLIAAMVTWAIAAGAKPQALKI